MMWCLANTAVPPRPLTSPRYHHHHHPHCPRPTPPTCIPPTLTLAQTQLPACHIYKTRKCTKHFTSSTLHLVFSLLNASTTQVPNNTHWLQERDEPLVLWLYHEFLSLKARRVTSKLSIHICRNNLSLVVN